MNRSIQLASLGRGCLRGRLKQSLRTKDKSPKNPQRKAAFVGLALASAAFALPSPWSWITFVIGLQFFAPLLGKAFKSNDAISRAETIAFLESQLDSLARDIALGDKHETGLTTHNKRIQYKTYFEMLERIRKEQDK